MLLCQGTGWCLLKHRDVELGEAHSDNACGVSLGVSGAACAPQPYSPGSASCSLGLWFWLSAAAPGVNQSIDPANGAQSRIQEMTLLFPSCASSTNQHRADPQDTFFPSAEVTCPRPPSIANGLHTGLSSGSFSRGVTVSYSCREGFELLGNESITCTDSGRWSRTLPRCEGLLGGSLLGRGCGTEGRVGEALPVQDPAPHALKLKGALTAPTAIGCQVPEVQNGKVHNVQSTYRAGDTLHFDCHPGHAAEGSDEARCQPGGIWDPPLLVQGFNPSVPITLPALPSLPVLSQNSISRLPLAVRPCPMPPEVANGNHNGRDTEGFTMGMSVQYTCDPGYYLVGNAAVTCRASGNWSQPRPRCEGESGLCPLGGHTQCGSDTGDTLTKSTETSSERLNSILMK
uniref:Sushi domain-containing protein n=1 Tax=Serinus canaria TaxID=9135 RepID=A0A8C9UHB3_SERCA